MKYIIGLLLALSMCSAYGQNKFDIGDRVVVSDVVEGGSANVRETPGGTLLGTQPEGALGNVTDGPVTTSNGVTWYRIDFDSGVDGWMGQSTLEEVGGGGGGTPPPPPPSGPLSAFPGAQGGGAQSRGGRSPSGAVFMVTNTANGGSGSLRACMEATGPRTCIFRTGGTAQHTSSLRPRSPGLTIAGQTAPGGGFMIGGKGSDHCGNVMNIESDHTIIRYLRVAKGRVGGGSECGANVFIRESTSDVIVDHVSSVWNLDENMSAFFVAATGGAGSRITFSWNLLGEGIRNTAEQRATGVNFSSKEPEVAQQQRDMDMHHNLTIHTSHRNPYMRNKNARVVNNLWYNNTLALSNNAGGVTSDIIRNKYKVGPFGSIEPRTEIAAYAPDANNSGEPSIFLRENVGEEQTTPPSDQFASLATRTNGQNGTPIGPVPASWRRTTPQVALPRPIVDQPIANIENDILDNVGASKRLDCRGNFVNSRDARDTRRINDYRNGTGPSGGIPDNESFYGGFENLAAGTPCIDSDLDGMPNEFETAMGFSNSNAADRNGDHDSDGYSNLEEYLDGIPEASPPPGPPPALTGTGVITESPGPGTGTGKVDVKGGPERRPFGRGTTP